MCCHLSHPCDPIRQVSDEETQPAHDEATAAIFAWTMSWLMNYRRLARRYEHSAGHFLAFADIACTMICYNPPHQMR